MLLQLSGIKKSGSQEEILFDREPQIELLDFVIQQNLNFPRLSTFPHFQHSSVGEDDDQALVPRIRVCG
jgi:hypothetical protein